MFEQSPNALFYLAMVGYSMILSTVNLFFTLSYARSQHFPKWKRHIAPTALIFAANATLVWYPFSDLPSIFANRLAISNDQTFLLLCIMYFFWFIASVGIFSLRAVVSGHAPRSFISYLFRYSEQRARENWRANEYTIMGIFGSAIGVPFISETFEVQPNSQHGSMLLIFLFGLASWFVLWFTRRIFSATEM